MLIYHITIFVHFNGICVFAQARLEIVLVDKLQILFPNQSSMFIFIMKQ